MIGGLLAAALVSSSLVAAVPAVSPETSFGSAALVNEGSLLEETDVAFDGANFFAVWDDDRCTSRRCIMGARVSPAGAVLDPTGILLSRGPGLYSDERVACQRLLCLVTWSDDVRAVHYTLVDTQNGVAGAVRTLSFPTIVTEVSVATFGDEFILATSATSSIFANRIARDGTNRDGSGIALISGTAVDQADVLEAGGNALFVWQDLNCGTVCANLVAARVDPSGTKLDAAPFVVTNAPNVQSQPRLTTDGVNALVVWRESNATTGTGISAARVLNNQVLDSPPVTVATGAANRAVPVFDGTDFVVVYTPSDPVLRRINPLTMQVSAAFTLSSVNAPDDFGVAAAGHIVAVTWARPPPYSVLLQRVDTSSPATVSLLGAPLVLTQSAQRQLHPSTAWNGTFYWVVWQGGQPTPGVYAARMNGAGVVLDEPPLSLGLDAGQVSPQVACPAQSESCFAVWASPGGMEWALLAPDGGIPSYGRQGDLMGVTLPEIACNSTDCLAVYRRGVAPGPFIGTLFGVVNGVSVTGPVTMMNGATGARGWVAGWDTSFLVARTSQSGVFASRYSADSGFEPLTGLQLAAGGYSDVAGAACDAVECSVLMMGGSGIRMRNTQPQAGSFTDPPAGTWVPPAGAVSDLRVASTGAIFSASGDLWFLPFTRDGGLEPLSAATLAQTGDDEAQPHVTAGANGQAVVAYARDVTSAPYNVARVRARRLSTTSESCVNAFDCPPGLFCVDGVCCNTSCGNGDPTDCLACSVEAGALVNGSCSARIAGAVCRGPGAFCDLPETCDGVATICPANASAPDGDVCAVGGSCGAGACLLADAGTSDAGTQDAGMADAGDADAGSADDGGVDSGELADRHLLVGCGCSTAPTLSLLAGALLLLLSRAAAARR